MDSGFLDLLRTESAALPGMVRLTKCARNTYLYKRGEAARHLYVIESGMAKLTGALEDDREVLLSLLGPGDAVGEKAVLCDTPRDHSVCIVKEACIFQVPAGEFRELCRRKPELWIMVAWLLARRAEQMKRRLELISFFRVEQRILHSLADLAEAFGGRQAYETCVEIPLSQADLANMVGATRETTSSMLNLFERKGLLRLGRRHVCIDSPQSLRHAARGAA